MIKKPWGAQSDDGREGMMNPNCKTSWHLHGKDTRIKATGLMYALSRNIHGHVRCEMIRESGILIGAGVEHCLFTCGEVAVFHEKGTEISSDIERMPWPNWADKIIGGVRDSHRGAITEELGVIAFATPELPDVPTEGYGRREVSGVTNSSDVTTLK